MLPWSSTAQAQQRGCLCRDPGTEGTVAAAVDVTQAADMAGTVTTECAIAIAERWWQWRAISTCQTGPITDGLVIGPIERSGILNPSAAPLEGIVVRMFMSTADSTRRYAVSRSAVQSVQ